MDVSMQIPAMPSSFSGIFHISSPKLYIFKKELSCYPPINRIIKHWQECIMILGVATAIIGIAIAIFTSSTLLFIGTSTLLITSGMGNYYLHECAKIGHLKTVVDGLRQVAAGLQGEVAELQNTNRELAETCENFRQTHADFVRTHNELEEANEHLTHQVASLTLQVTQLTQSSRRIQEQVHRFQTSNIHLESHVEDLDESLHVLQQEITTSSALCTQIQNHFNVQQNQLADQFLQLSQMLTELRADNGVHEKLLLLNSLNEQIGRATQDLHQTQLQYATERAHFEGIRDALFLIRDELNQINREFRGNVEDLREEREAMRAQRGRLENITQRFFLLAEPAAPLPFQPLPQVIRV